MTVKELKNMLKNIDDEAEVKIKLHVCGADQIDTEIEETYTDILNVITTTNVDDKSQTLDFECYHFLEKEEESK